MNNIWVWDGERERRKHQKRDSYWVCSLSSGLTVTAEQMFCKCLLKLKPVYNSSVPKPSVLLLAYWQHGQHLISYNVFICSNIEWNISLGFYGGHYAFYASMTSAKDTLEIAVELRQKISQEIKPLSLLFEKVFVSSLWKNTLSVLSLVSFFHVWKKSLTAFIWPKILYEYKHFKMFYNLSVFIF